MTTEIDQGRRARALQPSPADTGTVAGCGRIVTGVWIFGAVSAVGGLALVGLDLTHPHIRQFAVYAAACFVLAGLSVALICFRAMIANCQEFYRRGQLDGWMRGWRGQPPDVDDPLLR